MQEKDMKLAQINKDVSAITLAARQLSIKTADNMQTAVDFLGQIKARIKRIEELRLSFTKPLNESLRTINNEFKKASEPLEQAERTIKGLMKEYHDKEAEKIRKQQEKEAEKQRKEWEAEQERKRKEIENSNLTKKAQKEAIREIKQDEFEAKPTITQESTIKSESGSSVTFKTVTKWRLVNITKVPAQFLKVDEVAVNKAIRLGVVGIDGLELYEEKEVAGRI